MLSRNLSIIDKKYFYIEAAFIGFLLLLAERLKLVQISPEDFCQYYYAAKHFILNVPVYSAVPCARLIYPAQPPFATLIFLPFVVFPFKLASYFWGIISFSLYILAIVLLLKKTGWLSFKSVSLVLLFSIVWPTLILAQLYQNIGELLLFLIALSWFLKDKKYSYISGVLLGIASLLKIWPVLLLFGELVIGKKRDAAFGFLTVLFGLAISLIVLGANSYKTYLSVIPSYEEKMWYGHYGNLSIIGMLNKLFTFNGFSKEIKPIIANLPSSTVLNAGYFLSIITAFIVFIFMYWYKKRYKNAYLYKDVLIEGLLLTLALIIFPLSWDWNLIFLLLPLSVIFIKRPRLSNQTKLWNLPLFLAIIVMVNPFIIFLGYLIEIKLVAYVFISMYLVVFLIYQAFFALRLAGTAQKN